MQFTFDGLVHIDRDGIVYTAPSPHTGAATAVGTIDYRPAKSP